MKPTKSHAPRGGAELTSLAAPSSPSPQTKLTVALEQIRTGKALGDASFSANSAPFQAVERFTRSYLQKRYASKDSSDIDDATQEVLLKVWRAIDSFNPEVAAEKWLGAIASRATIDLWRRGAKGREVTVSALATTEASSETFDVPDSGRNDPAEIFFSSEMSRENIEATRAAVAKLPSILREVLDLRLQELPMNIIAETLVLPEGTVKNRLHRARALVKEALSSL